MDVCGFGCIDLVGILTVCYWNMILATPPPTHPGEDFKIRKLEDRDLQNWEIGKFEKFLRAKTSFRFLHY
jgi:hypothetical protein